MTDLTPYRERHLWACDLLLDATGFDTDSLYLKDDEELGRQYVALLGQLKIARTDEEQIKLLRTLVAVLLELVVREGDLPLYQEDEITVIE